ncbi:MAG: T9SS type A sorting domain-containing protein [Bacteroidetes bacterium]|nr:T9SS type A sorting domain-containing protein [Bacteroidota bacterium]
MEAPESQPKVIANPSKQQLGYFKPAITGFGQYFRVLFVFAEFEGNTYQSASWPLNSLPTWAGDLVDPNPDAYRPLTLSKFWDVMSMGQFDFIGDVYPALVTVKSETYYQTNGFNFTESNRDVLKKLDNDISLDWTRYDKWRYNTTTQAFEFGTDGIIDMIYIIYRNSQIGPKQEPGWFTSQSAIVYPENIWINRGNFAGIASLGKGPFSMTYLTDNYRTVNFDFGYEGSGITIRNGINYSSAFGIMELLAHEFGHYLLGSGHPENSFAIMSNYPELRNLQLNSLERERLGYISFQSIYQYNGQLFPLTDAVTTGNVLKVAVPGQTDFLIIENHLRKSPFDQIDRGGLGLDPNSTRGKGVYVFKISDSFLINSSSVLLKNADGSFNWGWAGDTYIGTAKVPLLEKLSVNRDGAFGDRNFNDFKYNINDTYGWAPFHVKNPLTKEWELTWACLGDEKDAYTLSGIKMMTPWSNPNSKAGGFETFSFEITNQNADVTSIKTWVYQKDALALPPSQPQLLKVSIENWNPKLTWSANIEPDLSGYKIYKSVTNGAAPLTWSLVTTVPKTASSYLDESVSVTSETQNQKIFYQVKAVDNTGLLSVASNFDWLFYNMEMQKVSDSNGNEQDLITRFSIENAYPNPFNPATTIGFSIPEQGAVNWQVYDTQGKLIFSAPEKVYPAGHHQVFFDGKHLSSGMYFIKMRYHSQIKTIKLLLAK